MENGLKPFEQEEDWYTIEDLASLSGISIETLKGGHSPLKSPDFGIGIKTESKIKNIGGHRNIRFYSKNVLKALKAYQIKNGASNAVKNKEVAVSGNISVIQNQTVKQTINNLLDNPETLNMLLQESLTRNKALGIENKQLKDVIETQKPMVEGYARIADSSGLKTIKEAANILGYGEKTYFAILRDMGILFRDNGINLPKREYIDSGYFEVKEEPYERNGQTYLYSRVFVTAKGLLWLEKKTPKEGLVS